MEFKAGDLVSCKDENYFSQLSLKKNCGIILDKKKTTYKVMFDDFAAGYWMNDALLEKTRSSNSHKVSPLVEEISQIVQKLNGLSFEIEQIGKEKKKTIHLTLILERVSMPELENLKKSLGSRLIRLDCLPHMMHELILEVVYT